MMHGTAAGRAADADAELRMLRAEVAQLREARNEASASSRSLKQAFHKNAALLQAQVQQWRDAAATEQEETRKAQREVDACRQTISSLESELTEARSEARECRQRAAEVRGRITSFVCRS